ncbi:putative Annexin superfamily [Helianthus debilis subsp. tardiflorus]
MTSIFYFLFQHFKNKYGGEFEEALKLVVKFLNNPPKYYAKALEASIKGRTTDEGDLERIIVSQSETDMNKIRKIYKNVYGMDMRDAIIESFPIGDFRDLLLALTMKTSIDND